MSEFPVKFAVGDKVKVTKSYANNSSAYAGDEGEVTAISTAGRYPAYTVHVINASSYRNGSWLFTASNLALVSKGIPPEPVVPVKDMDPEDLARKVVKVARKYAKDNNWCKVVDNALREAGLGDYMTVTKKVVVEVEVAASADDAAIREAAVNAVGSATIQ